MGFRGYIRNEPGQPNAKKWHVLRTECLKEDDWISGCLRQYRQKKMAECFNKMGITLKEPFYDDKGV